MQVTKNIIIILYFTADPLGTPPPPSPPPPLMRLTLEAIHKEAKKRPFSQHRWIMAEQTLEILSSSWLSLCCRSNRTHLTVRFQSLTVSIAQGISSKNCFLRCSFKQILGVNFRLLCKAFGPWSCGHVSLREERVPPGITVQDTAWETELLKGNEPSVNISSVNGNRLLK